jgi:hypothetical protein
MSHYNKSDICEKRSNSTRFVDYEKYLEFPVCLLMSLEKKRFEIYKQGYHYQEMEEYLEIPDMQVWLKLKNEIIHFPKTKLKSPYEYYEIQEDEDDEFRYKCFKDKWLSSRRRSDSF